MNLPNYTRCANVFAVSHLARLTGDPMAEMLEAAKHVLRYLAVTIEFNNSSPRLYHLSQCLSPPQGFLQPQH